MQLFPPLANQKQNQVGDEVLETPSAGSGGVVHIVPTKQKAGHRS
ncbi:hypothetical protein [Scytonema sp. NUACC21]